MLLRVCMHNFGESCLPPECLDEVNKEIVLYWFYKIFLKNMQNFISACRAMRARIAVTKIFHENICMPVVRLLFLGSSLCMVKHISSGQHRIWYSCLLKESNRSKEETQVTWVSLQSQTQDRGRGSQTTFIYLRSNTSFPQGAFDVRKRTGNFFSAISRN